VLEEQYKAALKPHDAESAAGSDAAKKRAILSASRKRWRPVSRNAERLESLKDADRAILDSAVNKYSPTMPSCRESRP